MSSIWHMTTAISQRPPLTEDIRTEVAIIGAGMTGILLADRLQSAGKEVVILEARRIGSGQTGGTTAKITAQHGLFYADLIDRLGEKQAAVYAKGHQQAIEEYRRIVDERNISCDFKNCRSFLYSDRDIAALKREADAAKRLGLNARYTESVPLPVDMKGAVCFDDQAIFHPLKFLDAVASDLTVYEKSPVIRVENNRVMTDRATVTADFIVFACHFPFVNFPGFYFKRMHQERSCVLALKTELPPPKDIYFGVDPDGFSLRPYKDMVLFGGGSYRTGTGCGGHYDWLKKAANEWFRVLRCKRSGRRRIPFRHGAFRISVGFRSIISTGLWRPAIENGG